MLLTWLLTPILAAFSAILGVLPTDTSFASYLGLGSEGVCSSCATVGASVGLVWSKVVFFLPMSGPLGWLVLVLTFILPAIVVFEVVQFLYRELPDNCRLRAVLVSHFLPYLLAFFITSSLWRLFYGWRRSRRRGAGEEGAGDVGGGRSRSTRCRGS